MATPGKQAAAEGPQNVCQVEELQEQPIGRPVVQRDRVKERNRGGYDCEFVHPPPDYFQTECSVCLQVLRDAHLASCCGRKECIERVQKVGKGCPLCSKEGYTLTYNRAHDVALKQLEVYCTHRKIGCEWKGKLEMLDEHLNVDPELEKHHEGCAFVELQCWHDDCGQSFQRHVIAKHQSSECPQRPFSCEHCHEYESTYHDVTINHWLVCKCYPVSCPNKCTSCVIERQNLEQHLNEECPLQEVECEFRYAGCETKLRRKDMPEHLKENVGHMLLLARQNQELMAKLLEKDEQIRRMTEESQREMERKIESLAIDQQEKLEQMKEQVEQLQQAIVPKAAIVELPSCVTELEQKSETDHIKVDRHIAEIENRSATSVTEMQQCITQLQNKKASAVEVKRCEDRVLTLEGSAITKAEREKLTHQVVTKRELEDRIGGLEQKQDTTKASLEKLHHHIQIAPVQVVMSNFEQHKRDNDMWRSEGFYTHPQGYKMCLRVEANGNGDDKGTHVSCCFYLMCGEFDNHLKWPFQGNLTIQLLNQRQDNKHCTKTVPFNDKTPDEHTARATSGERARGWGFGKFIPHSELGYTAATNCQYLVNDCLYFRVKVELF